MEHVAKIVPDIDLNSLCRNLKTCLSSNKDIEIPHKYFYWDYHCAELWNRLASSTKFLTHEQSKGHLVDDFPKIHESISAILKSPYDVVSLGVGIGQDDIEILKSLTSYTKKMYFQDNPVFFPIDISMHLIYHTLFNIEKAISDIHDNIDIAILNIDFLELNLYSKAIQDCSNFPRLFCSLGSTLGNYLEYQLLYQIFNAMGAQDLLLLGIDCPIDKFSDSEIINRYSDIDEGFDFLLGPIRQFHPELPTWDLKQKKQYIPVLFEKPSDKIAGYTSPQTIIPKSKHIYHEFQFPLGKEEFRIRLNKSTKYELGAFKEWLIDKFGFDIVEEFIPGKDNLKSGAYSVLLLLKKGSELTEKAKEELSEQEKTDATIQRLKEIKKSICDKADDIALPVKDRNEIDAIISKVVDEAENHLYNIGIILNITQDLENLVKGSISVEAVKMIMEKHLGKET